MKNRSNLNNHLLLKQSVFYYLVFTTSGFLFLLVYGILSLFKVEMGLAFTISLIISSFVIVIAYIFKFPWGKKVKQEDSQIENKIEQPIEKDVTISKKPSSLEVNRVIPNVIEADQYIPAFQIATETIKEHLKTLSVSERMKQQTDEERIETAKLLYDQFSHENISFEQIYTEYSQNLLKKYLAKEKKARKTDIPFEVRLSALLDVWDGLIGTKKEAPNFLIDKEKENANPKEQSIKGE